MDDHLSGPVITGRLERHPPPQLCRCWRDTALHAGKDLFVAPSSFDEILPEGSLGLSPSASLWSPLSSPTFAKPPLSLIRDDSAKVGLDDGRYPLPVSQPQFCQTKVGLGHVRTFLPIRLTERSSNQVRRHHTTFESARRILWNIRIGTILP